MKIAKKIIMLALSTLTLLSAVQAEGVNFMEENKYARIQNVMAKMRRGEEVRIAAFGGSITTGFNADPKSTKSWASLVGAWWKEKGSLYNSNVKFMNEGVSGTDSAFGVARVKQHLIDNKADLVILEFAMNDQWLETNVRQRSYEGVIRQLEENSERGILALFVNERFSPQKGQQYEQQPICEYYHIPFVSWKDCANKEYNNSPNWDSWFSGQEGIHPNNEGHAKIAEYIIAKLEEIWASLPDDKNLSPIATELPKPLTDTSYQYFTYYTSDNLEPLTNTGWKNSSPVHSEWVSHGGAKQGWSTAEEGAEITFKIHASSINVLYAESDGYRDCEAWVENADGTAGKKVVMRNAQSSRKGYLGWCCHEVVNGTEEKDYILHISCPKRRKTDQGKETDVVGIIACGKTGL